MLSNIPANLKITCFQTTVTYGSDHWATIASGRTDWTFFVPIVTWDQARTTHIAATPNGNDISIYDAARTGTFNVNVLCVGF